MCFVLFLVLGVVIFGRPHVLFDRRARWFRARSTRLALLLTLTGRTRSLAIAYGIAFAVFVLAHLHLRVPAVLGLSQMLSQSVVEGFKVIYRRARPDYWHHRLDPGHSYPSGHATTAVVTLAGWAMVVWLSALPLGAKAALISLLLLWAAAIDWSRLALGAHYFSDVLGGTLFGTAWLCALLAFFGNAVLVP
jgi:membrane-associated phospholipid phosphatase